VFLSNWATNAGGGFATSAQEVPHVAINYSLISRISKNAREVSHASVRVVDLDKKPPWVQGTRVDSSLSDR
jgi:hypothetical protein